MQEYFNGVGGRDAYLPEDVIGFFFYLRFYPYVQHGGLGGHYDSPFVFLCVYIVY